MTITILIVLVIVGALVGRLFGVKHIGSFVGLVVVGWLIWGVKKDPVGTAHLVHHTWTSLQAKSKGMNHKLNVFIASFNK